ncbi:MAG TPA: hypothetical protein EYN67_06150 [Flavobacteriales bacterium]|nr:hypothetical protein [Flavobacteriales bacterium]
MIDRKEVATEIQLRESIRKAIGIVKARRATQNQQEAQLRIMLRSLISESQTAVSTTAKHASTGINTLEDLLRNSNILSVLETGYKSLTTRAKDDAPTGVTKQRKSFRNHTLVAVEKILAPEESRKEAGEDIESTESTEDFDISEDISLEIGDRPEDDPDFIDVGAEETVKSDGEIEKEQFTISGEDMTGRNKAFTDFQTIEKVILRAFDDLDNPEDRNLFSEYLIKNLSLYFDKYESDLADDVEPPEAALDAEPTLSTGEAEDEEIANIELQEVIKHLNIEDIIANLL